jgi:hypothetical protein
MSLTGRRVVVCTFSARPSQIDGDPVGSGKELTCEVAHGRLLVRMLRWSAHDGAALLTGAGSGETVRTLPARVDRCRLSRRVAAASANRGITGRSATSLPTVGRSGPHRQAR